MYLYNFCNLITEVTHQWSNIAYTTVSHCHLFIANVRQSNEIHFGQANRYVKDV